MTQEEINELMSNSMANRQLENNVFDGGNLEAAKTLIKRLQAEIEDLRIDLQATHITSKMQDAVIKSAGEEIDHLRSLTRWHYAPEVPEVDGAYLAEVEINGFKAVYQEYFKNGHWDFNTKVIRWAYLPKDVLVDERMM